MLINYFPNGGRPELLESDDWVNGINEARLRLEATGGPDWRDRGR